MNHEVYIYITTKTIITAPSQCRIKYDYVSIKEYETDYGARDLNDYYIAM